MGTLASCTSVHAVASKPAVSQSDSYTVLEEQQYVGKVELLVSNMVDQQATLNATVS